MATAFKVGEKVRYTKADTYPEMKGWVGKVVEASRNGNTRVETLENPGNYDGTYVGNKGLYYTENLSLIEEPQRKFKIGEPVNVNGIYASHKDRKDLVILGYETSAGYRVGAKGNSASRDHDGVAGWLYYDEAWLTPRVERTKPSDFTKGEKVKIKDFTASLDGKTAKVVDNITRYVIVLVDDTKTREYLLPKELEVIEEKEKEVTEAIKVGDKVTVDAHAPASAFHGVEGEVVELLHPGKSQAYIKVTKTNGKVNLTAPVGKKIYLYGLTKLPEFKFKDIEKGDTIRRTYTYDDGSLVIKEGVVNDLSAFHAQGKHFTLATRAGDEDSRIKLELINRPEKPKHWAHTKPVGALAVMRANDRVLAATLTKTDEDTWVHNYVSNNNSRTYTNDRLVTTSYATDETLNWLN